MTLDMALAILGAALCGGIFATYVAARLMRRRRAQRHAAIPTVPKPGGVAYVGGDSFDITDVDHEKRWGVTELCPVCSTRQDVTAFFYSWRGGRRVLDTLYACGHSHTTYPRTQPPGEL